MSLCFLLALAEWAPDMVGTHSRCCTPKATPNTPLLGALLLLKFDPVRQHFHEDRPSWLTKCVEGHFCDQ